MQPWRRDQTREVLSGRRLGRDGLQGRCKPADTGRDFVAQFLEGEVTRLEKIEIDRLQIGLIGVGAGCGKDDVILASAIDGIFGNFGGNRVETYIATKLLAGAKWEVSGD